MDIVHERAAGIDISKRDGKVAVRRPGARAVTFTTTITTWGATVGALTELAEHLLGEAVTVVVMEATGDYWKPFYFLLEAAGLPVMLVNAKQARNIPGPSRVARPMCRTRPGWRSLVHMACCGARSSHRNRSGSSGT